MKTGVLRNLTIDELVTLNAEAESVMAKIKRARMNGGKYGSVEKMFEAIKDYEEHRSIFEERARLRAGGGSSETPRKEQT